MIKQQYLKENDVVNDQFVILEKFDSKKHSSKIYKGIHDEITLWSYIDLNYIGWDRVRRCFVVIKSVISLYTAIRCLQTLRQAMCIKKKISKLRKFSINYEEVEIFTEPRLNQWI